MSDNEMPDLIVTYDPDEVGQPPYLKEGGAYGPGMEHEADVTISRVQLADKTRETMPKWMKEDPCDFIEIGYKVVSTEFGTSFVNDNKRLGRETDELARSLGLEPSYDESTDEQGRTRRRASFNLKNLVGLKVGRLEVKSPNAGKNGVMRNGFVVSVAGL